MSVSCSINETVGLEAVSCVAPTAIATGSRAWRELGRNLWLALCCLLGFAWIRESPAYFSYLVAMLLEPVAFSPWGQVSVVWLLLAKSALALLPVLPLSFWLFRRGRFLWGRFAMGSCVALILVWLFIDQIVLVMTSNHSSEYLGFLTDATAWQWAGESAHLAKVVLCAAALSVLAVWGLFELIAALDSRWGRTSCHTIVVRGGLLALLLALFGWQLPRLGASAADERVLGLLERNLAWRPLFCAASESGSFATSELQSQATAAYSQAMSELSVQPLDRDFRIQPDERRHVVFLVLESFRRDLLQSETMPHCSALAEDGLFCEQHYSNSNMSHYGLFSLMYGRLPFLYDQLLDRKVVPQACETFRDSGYHSTFITSGDCTSWLRMGEFLGRDTFDDVQVHKQKSWVDRDRQSLAKVSELLKADARERPQFVVCFLMATHFPYEFPANFARYQPTAKAKDVLAVQQPGATGDSTAIRNRQKNAASFLDEEIFQLAKSCDRHQTLFLMTGDHAESFQEDGSFFHGSRLSDAQTTVPALIWGANVSPMNIGRRTSHVDLLPTVCSLLTNGRTVKSLHGKNVLANRTDDLDQVLLTHGRMTSNTPFERVLLVSDECRLPMLLHKAHGGAVTVLDPVDHRDRILPLSNPSAESLKLLSQRIDKVFVTRSVSEGERFADIRFHD